MSPDDFLKGNTIGNFYNNLGSREGIDNDILTDIKKHSFKKEVVLISNLLKTDTDLHSFIKTQLSEEDIYNTLQPNINQPIIIINNKVIDGYHRIAENIRQKNKNVLAYVSVKKLTKQPMNQEYTHKSRHIFHATDQMTGIERLSLEINQGLRDIDKIRPLIDNGWELSEKYLTDYKNDNENISFSAQKGTDVLNIQLFKHGGTNIEYQPNQPILEDIKEYDNILRSNPELDSYHIVDIILDNDIAYLTDYKNISQDTINTILSSKELTEQKKIVAFTLLKVDNPGQLISNHLAVNKQFSKYENGIKQNPDKFIIPQQEKEFQVVRGSDDSIAISDGSKVKRWLFNGQSTFDMKLEDFNKVKDHLTFDTVKAASLDDAYNKTISANKKQNRGL